MKSSQSDQIKNLMRFKTKIKQDYQYITVRIFSSKTHMQAAQS